MMSRPLLRLSLVIGVVSCVALLVRANQETPQERTVCAVNGEAISASSLAVSASTVEARFTQMYKRPPRNVEEMEGVRADLVRAKLRARIQQTIRAQQVHALGVTVSDEEVRRRWDELKASGDFGTDATAREMLHATAASLKDVYEEGRDATAVYELRLKGYMTPQQWTSYVQRYRTPKSWRLIEELAEAALTLDKETADGIRWGIRIEKTRAKIEERILATNDPEIQRYLDGPGPNPTPEQWRENANFMDRKRMEWWEARYRAADVRILDPKLSEAWPSRMGRVPPAGP